jgi:hypothetical protein
VVTGRADHAGEACRFGPESEREVARLRFEYSGVLFDPDPTGPCCRPSLDGISDCSSCQCDGIDRGRMIGDDPLPRRRSARFTKAPDRFPHTAWNPRFVRSGCGSRRATVPFKTCVTLRVVVTKAHRQLRSRFSGSRPALRPGPEPIGQCPPWGRRPETLPVTMLQPCPRTAINFSLIIESLCLPLLYSYP